MPTDNVYLHVTGAIFQIQKATKTTHNTWPKKNFVLYVINQSGAPIEVVVDRQGGAAKTGQIGDNAAGSITESIDLYLHQENKLTRWRPGAFGIPGNGGGDIAFDLPPDTIETEMTITVTG